MRIRTALAIGTLAPFALIGVHCSSSSSSNARAPAAEAGAPGSEAGITDAGADSSDGSGSACPPGLIDGALTTYAPDDSHIQYAGRFDMTNPKQPKFAASSVYISANFEGSQVSVSFQDGPSSGNLFEVIVDSYPPVVLTTTIGQTSYPVVPSNDAGAPITLPCGTHKVTFIKRTEADYGDSTFLGFTFDGPILAPDAKPAHRIEVIGDSITCGAGVEAASTDDVRCMENGMLNIPGVPEAGYQSGFGGGVENGYLAYGSVLGRLLGAEWVVTCQSGIGLYRNYYNLATGTMPQIYDFLFPGDSNVTQTWATNQFVPDVIAIGLGTNDFSHASSTTNVDGRPALDVQNQFVPAFIQFINQLATYYPGVNIVLVSSPILGDQYPTSSDMDLTSDRNAMCEIADYYGFDGGCNGAQAGAFVPEGGVVTVLEGGVVADSGPPPNVRVVPAIVDKVIGTGCGGHPNAQQQAAAAAQIAQVVQNIMGW